MELLKLLILDALNKLHKILINKHYYKQWLEQKVTYLQYYEKV